MAYQSIASKILARVRGRGRGSVLTANEFLDLASRSSVDQALSRLARRGLIRRIARGLYDLPRKSPRLGRLAPPPDAVARAVARKSGTRLQPSGARAANALGLSTQVPALLVYDTEGKPKEIQLEGRTIRFRQKAARRMHGAGTTAGAVLQALAYLGKDGVQPHMVSQLGRALSATDKRKLRALSKTAPAWMHPIIREITEQPKSVSA